MKTKKLLFYLLAVILGGCVPSLHPLYTEKDIIFEEKLLGKWADGKDSWEFEKGSEPNSYDLTTISDDKTGGFVAHLVKIDDMRFLDLFPKDPELEENDFYKLHLLLVHTFMKVEQIEPELKLRMMDADTLKEKLEEDPNLVKHEVLKDRGGMIVLTASPKELQEFMRKHADDEGLFGEASKLARIEPKDSNEPMIFEPNTVEPNIVEPGERSVEK